MTEAPSVILHTDQPASALAVLAETHPDLEVRVCDSYAALPAMLDAFKAEVVYTVRFDGTPRFPRAALLQSESVRWISVGGSGVDHLRSWDPERLTVTNAAGVAADMMAEYVLGAMLSFALRLPEFAARQRERQWSRGLVEPIAGSAALILGLGHTGTAVARRLQAMGVTTIGVRAKPRTTPFVDEVHPLAALPSLWARADYIVCCLPLSEATRGFLSERAFAAMKASAVLIDVSRGGVVNEAALIEALESRRLKGAALDVFETEPLPPDHRLWGFANVIVTPHCSSVYPGWETKSVKMFAENLSRYRRGESLSNVVDPERGY